MGSADRNIVRAIAPVALVWAGLTLQGCAEAVIGAGATAATGAVQERGLKAAATDTAIAGNINALWLEYNPDLVTRVDVTVTEGRVLLTGAVPTQDMRLEAVRLAWRSPGVKAVINEISVRNSEGISGYARDAWITTQLVGRLTADERVQAINYSVETVGGTVYLMGIAQNQEELDRVRNHARHLRYVRRIVSHVRLKDDPGRLSGGT